MRAQRVVRRETSEMTIPFLKEIKIGAYLLKQKMAGRERYPLVLMLEPLVPLQPRLRRLRQDRLP